MAPPSSVRPSLRGPVVLLACAAAWAAAVACGENDAGPEGGNEEGAARTLLRAPAGPGPGLEGDTVFVDLDEYVIDMPDTLPAGRLVLRARNVGFEDHDLQLTRDSTLLAFRRPLPPGGRGSLEVTLTPGTWRVTCTVSGHDGRGMTRDVVVEPR